MAISSITDTHYDMRSSTRYLPALILVGCLFFIFGFITWSNSQLIPYLKIACELTDTQSYYVATAFFAAYFVMGLPSSYILNKTGFKKGMSLGLLIMALGALLFIPAAGSRSYPTFLTGLFIIGTGLALLQTAANPYVTVLGPIDSAAQRISIMGICNKIAGILAVVTLGSITLSNADELKASLLHMNTEEKKAALDTLAQKVVFPYVCIAATLALLSLAIYLIKLPQVHEDEAIADNHYSSSKKSILNFPHLLMGALAIFFYVGVEVISYDTFTGFGESLGFPLSEAKTFATYTGYGLLTGYVLSIVAIPRFISQQKALAVSIAISLVMVLLSMFTTGYTAVFCFAVLGFSNSVVWPAIWPLAIDDLGRFTKTGSALLVMGIVGGAVLPPLYGSISELLHSRQIGYAIMLPCYLYILYFAFKGYKYDWAQRKGK